MFVRNGAVTPGPSRECDITFLVKWRPKSAQQLRDSTVPKGPEIAEIKSRLKLSISSENFNLAWNVQSWPSEFPTKIGGWLA